MMHKTGRRGFIARDNQRRRSRQRRGGLRDNQANNQGYDREAESLGSAVHRRAGLWRVGLDRLRAGWRLGSLGPGGPRAEFALVPGRPMEPRLGQHLGLGLGTLPRLARFGRPVWSRRLGALGPSAGVGAAPAASPAVGTRGKYDVESHCQ